MIESQKEKLRQHTSEYLSIGITSDGEPVSVIGVPWDETVHAFNMRRPNIFITPEDLQDEELMTRLESFRVIGCYIWAPLEDYGFLSRFKRLQDINIKNGDAIRDLDFLAGLHNCDMFYVQNAKLKNLNAIVQAKKNSKHPFSTLHCIGLYCCDVQDLSAFADERLYFSEFLVWQPQGRNEKERWKAASAGKCRYYELDI